ncbi:MAG: helix-turn-helix domain-containing protein [Lachnospiraceae bacterium]|nr:helix-turn-helix domain-containing protein [Lachnospiraceae bacterium]
MNHVLLAVKSRDILAQITALHIWGKETDFEITAICGNVDEAYRIVSDGDFALMLIETSLAEADHFQTLKRITHDNLCSYLAFCSHKGSFECARNGILVGIKEYFTLPFDPDSFLRIFEKIKAEKMAHQVNVEMLAEKLLVYFHKQDAGIYGFLDQLSDTAVFFQAVDLAVKSIFDRNDWLDLYYNEEDFYSVNTSCLTEQKSKFCQLFVSSCTLYPHHNTSLREVIRYILYNPEGDLRQKFLSEKLHLNKSYLSTVFTAQTGQRFVDYITYVRLMRAAWLLRNTDVKIGEVAQRMEYKDIAYFSKLFKKQFNMTPSEYRIPDSYQFEI